MNIKMHNNKQSNATPEDEQQKIVESVWASNAHFLHHLDTEIWKMLKFERLHIKKVILCFSV